MGERNKIKRKRKKSRGLSTIYAQKEVSVIQIEKHGSSKGREVFKLPYNWQVVIDGKCSLNDEHSRDLENAQSQNTRCRVLEYVQVHNKF